MVEWMLNIMEQGGYMGVFALMLLENLFPPIPSELIMPLAGFHCARGGFELAPTIIAGTLGSVAGAMPWYWGARALGEQRFDRFVARYGAWLTMDAADAERARAWFRSRTLDRRVPRPARAWRAHLDLSAGRFVSHAVPAVSGADDDWVGDLGELADSVGVSPRRAISSGRRLDRSGRRVCVRRLGAGLRLARSGAIARTEKRHVNLTHLEALESESIHILREAVSEARNPVLLFSAGKDSTVLAHLALRAFFPAVPPMPLLHIDSTWEFRELLEFRDHFARQHGMELRVYANEEGRAQGVNPFEHGDRYTTLMRTEALKQALDQGGYDVIFGGARRDEEKSRAKERIFSVRNANHSWEPRNQRPELWRLYNNRMQRRHSLRVLSNWTELDLWSYIISRDIDLAHAMSDFELRAGEVAVEAESACDASLTFIGRIHTPWTSRLDCPRQGSHDGPVCMIEVFEPWVAALDGVAKYEKLEVLYWFDKSRRDLVHQSPANDGATRGTFALRSPIRPNPIATSIVSLEAIEGPRLVVRGLDCLDGTPLLDIKPDRSNFAPAASSPLG